MADFHIHSSFSDGKLSIPEIVDLYGTHGFGAIAITDHLCEERTFLGKAAAYLDRTLTPNSFQKYIDTINTEAERAWHQYQMLLIPGFEITKNSLSNHRSAHMLGLGISQFVKADLSIEEICLSIKNQGALTIAAHPVSTGKIEKQTLHLWSRRHELKQFFDAWEVASGKHFFDEVFKSGLPMIANSDLHRREQFDSWKTVFRCERNKESIFNAIRKQEIEFKYHSPHAASVNYALWQAKFAANANIS